MLRAFSVNENQRDLLKAHSDLPPLLHSGAPSAYGISGSVGFQEETGGGEKQKHVRLLHLESY